MNQLAHRGDTMDLFMVESFTTPGAFLEWPGPVRLMMLGTGGGLNAATFLNRKDAEQYAADAKPAGRVVRLVVSRP